MDFGDGVLAGQITPPAARCCMACGWHLYF